MTRRGTWRSGGGFGFDLGLEGGAEVVPELTADWSPPAVGLLPQPANARTTISVVVYRGRLASIGRNDCASCPPGTASIAAAMREIFPGVIHWTAFHKPIRTEVSSYFVQPAAIVLDPKVPEGALRRSPDGRRRSCSRSSHPRRSPSRMSSISRSASPGREPTASAAS